jgi:hypothetical protein
VSVADALALVVSGALTVSDGLVVVAALTLDEDVDATEGTGVRAEDGQTPSVATFGIAAQNSPFSRQADPQKRQLRLVRAALTHCAQFVYDVHGEPASSVGVGAGVCFGVGAVGVGVNLGVGDSFGVGVDVGTITGTKQ